LARIGIDEGKVQVYTYWVDQEVFRPLDRDGCKERLGWKGKFIVLFVGRFIRIKGAGLLIETAKQVDRRICFAFIGDGPLAEEIKGASLKSENILYVGKIDNKELSVYYNASDIVIVPSQYEEGFGRVILEALSCGTPVIASNRGGIPEAVDEVVGVLVEPTVENLRRVIKELYHNRGKLERLANNCRRYAERNFSEENAHVIVRSYDNA
jgi:glycosyltransferase involved in cell wall biosynthesis